MYMERIIFSVDNAENIHSLARATRVIDEYRAMDKFKGSVVNCIGSYDNKLEPAFMVWAVDWDNWLKDSWIVANQESVLRVPGDNRQPCTLEYLDDIRERKPLYPMREVSPRDADGCAGWTYVLATGNYFTCS